MNLGCEASDEVASGDILKQPHMRALFTHQVVEFNCLAILWYTPFRLLIIIGALL
jgi:hypothetical protein